MHMSYIGLSLQYYSLSFIIEQAMNDFKLQLIRAQTFQSLQVVAISFLQDLSR